MINNDGVYDVTAIASILEQLGTKEKFWFKGYWDNFDDNWLFKYSRENTGEHWSEKVAEQLCSFLDIPHAEYHIAESNRRIGVISRSLVFNGQTMIMGNQLLYEMNPEAYPKPEFYNNEAYMHVKEHTIDSIFDALISNKVFPSGDYKNRTIDDDEFQDQKPSTPYNMISPEGMDACDVFCGYLMLDALISNQDRHHENWAILESSDGKFLCPSFDHAASLGRELLDDERKERLTTKDKGRSVSHFVTRAKSEIFASKNDKKRLSTIDAFFESVINRQDTKRDWLSKLKGLSDDKIAEIFGEIPDTVITPYAKEFAIAMVLANKKRLLEDERS